MQQVFYSVDSCNLWWKVILHKESWSKCMFLNTYGEYISKNEYGSVLDAWRAMPNAPTTPSHVGVILMSREESLLLNEQGNLALKDNPKEEIIRCKRLFQ